MEKMKQQRERALEDALADVGMRYWEYEIDTKRLYRSKLVQNEVGYSAYKENVPESFVEDGTIHPDYVQDYIDFYYNLKKGINNRLTFRSKFKDGSWGWLDISYKVLFNQAGKPYKAIGIGGDVTQQKEMERTLRKHQAQLEEALQSEKEANNAKSEFLTRMSHDMRTPLNVIMGMTHLAQENQNSEDTNACLEKINIASEFLLGLINDVLDMEHVDSGKIKLHLVPYSGQEFSQYISAVIRPLCAQKDIDFRYTYDGPKDFTIMQDKLRTNQVYFNLLSNAVKFTPEGGEVIFHTDVKRLENDKILLVASISDNGIGMSDEFQKRMFEPFAQEDQTVTPLSEGTGLGLTIVKRMCDLMKMDIKVISEPGNGTTITVSGVYDLAPEVTDQEIQKVNHKEEDVEAVLKNRTILVCEDHPMNQEIICRLLQKKGAIVIATENGKRGLDLFSQSSPGTFSLILMDIRMPVMDGMAASRAIRSLPREDAQQIPIIALTANAYDEDIKKCMDAGMNEHMAKPIDVKALYEILIKYLHN